MEMFRQVAPEGVVNKEVVPSMTETNITIRLHGKDGEKTASVNSSDVTTAPPKLAPGEAAVQPAQNKETTMTHEEMSKISPAECPFLMNKE